MVRYVHKISPRDTDTAGPIHLREGDLKDRKSLGAALRRERIMSKGDPILSYRREGSKIVVFPGGRPQIWHAIVLTLVGA